MIEEIIEMTFSIKCICGCNEEAKQIVIIRGIPLFLPKINPMTHYMKWKRKISDYDLKELGVYYEQ